MIAVTVMYPQTDDLQFDMDYYMNNHVTLVQDKWGSLGLANIRILKGLGGGAPGAPAPYHAIAILDFESMEDFQAAAGAHGKEIFADIPKFTNAEPVVQISDIA